MIQGFQTFKSENVSSPEEYLNVVLQAQVYISKHAVYTTDGIYWKNKDQNWREIDEIDLSFYSGDAGILYFYLKLWEVTRDGQWLEIVHSASKYLALHWKDFFTQAPVFHMMDLPGSQKGLYFGIAGIGLVLTEVYRSTADSNAKQGAKEILEYYIKEEKDSSWTGLTGLAMDGGILLFLLNAYKVFPSQSLRSLIEKAGQKYVNSGTIHEDGSLEFDGCHTFTNVSWPNYEFGTAGAGFLLTKLHEFTGNSMYLDAAKKTTKYLSSIQEPQSKGYLIPHDVKTLPNTKPIYFLSSCHGPGGNAKLYYQLYKLTDDKTYISEIEAMVDGIESTGAPERQSPGFWNTMCFCCGHAGLVQFFLGLYHSLHDERYLILAKRAANVIMGERIDHEDGTTSWSMAFWRTRPDFLTTDLGYYDGIAGIASALLQIYLQDTKDFRWNRLIDDPFI